MEVIEDGMVEDLEAREKQTRICRPRDIFIMLKEKSRFVRC